MENTGSSRRQDNSYQLITNCINKACSARYAQNDFFFQFIFYRLTNFVYLWLFQSDGQIYIWIKYFGPTCCFFATLQASEMENTGSSRGQDNSYRGRGPNITRHNYGWFTRIAQLVLFPKPLLLFFLNKVFVISPSIVLDYFFFCLTWWSEIYKILILYCRYIHK